MIQSLIFLFFLSVFPFLLSFMFLRSFLNVIPPFLHSLYTCVFVSFFIGIQQRILWKADQELYVRRLELKDASEEGVETINFPKRARAVIQL